MPRRMFNREPIRKAGVLDALNRPLPSFAKWLDDRNGGERGGDFEHFNDLARRTQDQTATGLNDDERAFLRMWQGMCVAVVELCNIEHKNGRGPDQIIQMFPRVLATAAVYAVASVVKDDAPFRTLAKIMTEEFRAAAKVAADGLTAKQDEA